MKKLILALGLISCKGSTGSTDQIVAPPETQEPPPPALESPANDITLNSLYDCQGYGEDLQYQASVELYSNYAVTVFLKIWGPTGVVEDIELNQIPRDGAYYHPFPVGAPPGTALSTKIQHGFTAQYRRALGLNEDARLFVQLIRAETDGLNNSVDLKIGQMNDPSKPESIGLVSTGCWKISE